MPARVIRLWTPPHARLWRAARIAYLRWRIACAQADIRYLETDPHHDRAQAGVYRRQIGVWEVLVLTLENQ